MLDHPLECHTPIPAGGTNVPDYNLSGLAPRSFEQLVQALAAKLIGPNIVIFGDGPDGAREATFDGSIPYPNSYAPWRGYGVVQAKYLQRTTDVRRDGQWFLHQLSEELKKFSDSKRKLRKPEYYIIATNVVLTPVGGHGFKDKATSLFRSFKEKIGLKEFDIWDFDKIRTYLDNNRDVATSYAAWITPGDVLARIFESTNFDHPKFEQVITNFLSKELLRDRYVNLEQAGHVTENNVRLSAVFTDLPASFHRVFEPEVERNPQAAGIISEILTASRSRFDPESVPPLASRQGANARQTRSGKYVLIGGPGQGKTTLSQYLCQLFRTALLQNRPRLSYDVKRTIDEIRKESSSEGIQLPSARRFPVRIALSELARELAVQSSEVTSLLSYISRRISLRTDITVDTKVFRQWMATYPWLLILDGLDEVPASSNRDQVLTAVTDFWVDASELNADILVVATTRPQGYSNEFSPEFYIHKFLAPLSESKALKYAQKLISVRFSADPDRQGKVVSRLRRAAKENSTARLMRTPLQVTIMAELVDRLGRPPQERWGLFKEYYKVIYDREVERDIPAAIVLREYRSDIDAIHSQTGLLLQLESERTGQTDAKLSSARFRDLVRSHFREEGHFQRDIDELTNKVISAAAQRLVFLVGVEADQVGFEIRSLQEFMAAEGLMQGEDKCVQDRLRSVAPLVNWRPVFLFAAGRCYTDRKYLRDTIQAICSELNEGQNDAGLKLVRAGSQLALDLLEDGSARTQPKHYQALARIASRLLNAPPDETHIRLASTYSPDLDAVYKEEIERQLGDANAQGRAAAWLCVVQLGSAGVKWAEGLLEGATSTEDRAAIVEACATAQFSDRIRSVIRRSVAVVAPTTQRRRQALKQLSKGNFLGTAPWVDAVKGIVEPNVSGSGSVLTQDGNRVLTFGFMPIRPNWIHGLRTLENAGDEWRPYLRLADFMTAPSANTLANVLTAIADRLPERPLLTCLPWPVKACLDACETREDLLKLAEAVLGGKLGDQVNWLAAEKRWAAGVTISEMFGRLSDRRPFDPLLATHGLVTGAVSSITLNPISSHLMTELLPQLRSIPDEEGRGTAACWVLHTFRNLTGPSTPNQQELLDLLLLSTHSRWSIDLGFINKLMTIDDNSIRVLNEVGREATHLFALDPVSADKLNQLANAYNADHTRLGLLRILAVTLQDSPVPDISIPRAALSILEPRFKSAAVNIRFASGVSESADEEDLVSLVLDPESPKREQDDYFDSALETIVRRVETEKAMSILVQMADRLRGAYRHHSKIIRALDATIRKRHSNILDPEVWAALQLIRHLHPRQVANS